MPGRRARLAREPSTTPIHYCSCFHGARATSGVNVAPHPCVSPCVCLRVSSYVQHRVHQIMYQVYLRHVVHMESTRGSCGVVYQVIYMINKHRQYKRMSTARGGTRKNKNKKNKNGIKSFTLIGLIPRSPTGRRTKGVNRISRLQISRG